jgi:hypothetical protein
VNTVQYPAAHYLQSTAFSNGPIRSLIVINLHRTSALTVNFAGAGAPHGAVTFKQLTATNLTDANESAENVTVTTRTMPNFNPAQDFSLAPFSMNLLQWQDQIPLAVGTSSAAGTFSWPAIPRRAYQVQHSADLSNWFDAGSAITAADQIVTFSDDGSRTGGSPAQAARRFYRVRSP